MPLTFPARAESQPGCQPAADRADDDRVRSRSDGARSDDEWSLFTPPGDYHRQCSDTSMSSAFETPRSTPKSTPQKQFVKFVELEPRARTGSNSSTSSNQEPVRDYSYSSEEFRLPSPLPPLPPRRMLSQPEPPERPGTLDISSAPPPRRPSGGILKYSSPGHHNKSPKVMTPTTSDSGITGDADLSFVSSRSRMSPGSTPPHITAHFPATLTHIDVDDAQPADTTAKSAKPAKPASHQSQLAARSNSEPSARAEAPARTHKQSRKLSFSDVEHTIL